jgi:hypothetical protein
MFGGKRVGGLRIMPPPQSKAKTAPAPPPVAEMVVDGFQADDSDVPF